MRRLNPNSVKQYVEETIGDFHAKRLHGLDGLRLTNVIKRKNPYLFRAKNVLTADQIVRGIVDAHLSSNEETVFGDWLEGLAIFVNAQVYGGWKSGITGIDLEFDKDDARYIVTIKSGPNWGNSSQINKMASDFRQAKKTLRTSNSQLNAIAVNGCCYGKERNLDKGEWFKFCGQKFWEFISGDPELYVTLIEPLGYKAKEKDDLFVELYAATVNRLTKEFTEEFCKATGEIDWERLVMFNSQSAWCT